MTSKQQAYGEGGAPGPVHDEPRILIVEDDDNTRESLRDILEDEGYNVAEAAHGKAALELLAAGVRPSLIFLDLMMPVMTGFEFLEALRCDATNGATPVVVVSAWPDQAAKVEGAQGFLKKPFDLRDLFDYARRFTDPEQQTR